MARWVFSLGKKRNNKQQFFNLCGNDIRDDWVCPHQGKSNLATTQFDGVVLNKEFFTEFQNIFIV